VRIIVTLVILLGVALGVSSTFACGGEHPVLRTEKEDGTKIGLFISFDQIKATKKWSPEEGEPPLSISDAYSIVKDWGKKEYARYDSVEIRELKLAQHGCSLFSNSWYYVVDFTPVLDGNKLWGSGNWVAVLMDGTVIAPQEF
jgi:hypothetical protein